MAKKKREDRIKIWGRAFYSVVIATGIAVLGILGTNASAGQTPIGFYSTLGAIVVVIGTILLSQYKLGEIEAKDKAEEQEAQLEAHREVTKQATKEGMLEALRAFRDESNLTREQIQRLVDGQPEETEDSKPPQEQKQTPPKKTNKKPPK